jgi:hypothetical protein
VSTYVTYDPYEPKLEVRYLQNGDYETQAADAEGRVRIPELDLWLGIWSGERLGQTMNWLRWWDSQGNLLLWSSEQAQQERLLAQQERQRAQQERQRAEVLAAKLWELGVDPERLA